MRDLTTDIDQISEIVAFPTIIAEIQSEIMRDNVASARVAQLVKMDAALTIQVLRAVNSPFYGLRWEVTSVTQAIAILGIDEVGRLVLMFHLRQQIYKLDAHQAYYLDALWRHCLATAIVSQGLATKIGLRPFGKAFTGGLLHDIGKIVLAQYYPIYLDEIKQLAIDDGIKDIDAEVQLVGINHCEIGACLCKKWMLPHELIEVIQNHHESVYSDETKFLTAVIRFSDLLCEQLKFGIGEQALTFKLEEDISWKIIREKASDFENLSIESLSEDLSKELSRRADLFHIT